MICSTQAARVAENKLLRLSLAMKIETCAMMYWLIHG